MKKSVLHELLAVEGDLDGAHKRILEETKTTFTKKAELFLGHHQTLEMFVDDGIKHPEMHKEIDTTVGKKLKYMESTEKRYFDAMLQKEATNQTAVADLIVDGVTVGTEFPATFLLGMETRLKHLRGVYEVIPTLQPGISWVKDDLLGEGVYKTELPSEKLKTETSVKPVVMYEATKEHPAQVKEVSEVKNIGKYVVNNWSGMISPAEKSALLGKIDKLIRAFKQARQRANTTEVVNRSIGAELFAFIDSK